MRRAFLGGWVWAVGVLGGCSLFETGAVFEAPIEVSLSDVWLRPGQPITLTVANPSNKLLELRYQCRGEYRVERWNGYQWLWLGDARPVCHEVYAVDLGPGEAKTYSITYESIASYVHELADQYRVVVEASVKGDLDHSDLYSSPFFHLSPKP